MLQQIISVLIIISFRDNGYFELRYCYAIYVLVNDLAKMIYCRYLKIALQEVLL